MNSPTHFQALGPSEPVSIGIDPQSLDQLRALQREYGDVVALTRPNGRRGWFINHPDFLHRLLVKHHGKFYKGPGFERVKMLLGNGLIVSDGTTWRRSRRMIQPAFSRKKLHLLIDMMRACCDERARRWAEKIEHDNGRVNITREMNDAGLELILRAIFGPDYDRAIATEGQNPFAFLSEDATRDLRVVLQVRDLRSLILSIIEHRRQQSDADHFDFLSVLMGQTDRDGQGFSDAELLDEIITLTVAGYETSAGTLNWAWYLLATHPEVEQTMLREFAEIDSPSLDADTLSNLTYCQQVLDETLRLYPPVWLFTRRAVADFELDDLTIRDGDDVYISPLILHTTAHHWPDPERFDPTRFAPGTRIADGLSLPFSLGPRRCLGEYFSFLEMKLMLATLLPKFSVATNVQPDLELGINLRSAEPIYLTIEQRAA
ncbi:MAG: cytochrome P450 [Pseudomonadota bacterium]